MNSLKLLTLSGTMTVLPVKGCVQVGEGYSMLSYFIYSIWLIS